MPLRRPARKPAKLPMRPPKGARKRTARKPSADGAAEVPEFEGRKPWMVRAIMV